jgi:hypothetical protein
MSTEANKDSFDHLPDEERDAGQLRLSREDFAELPLVKVQELTGLDAPVNGDAADIEKYRLQAWESYQIDVENRDEWGTARQGIPLPD